MESILKSDIFFFITSISVVVISSFILVALFYFIKMLRNFYKISNILKTHIEDTDAELKDISQHIKQSPLFIFFFGKEKVKSGPEKHYKKSI